MSFTAHSYHTFRAHTDKQWVHGSTGSQHLHHSLIITSNKNLPISIPRQMTTVSGGTNFLWLMSRSRVCITSRRASYEHCTSGVLHVRSSQNSKLIHIIQDSKSLDTHYVSKKASPCHFYSKGHSHRGQFLCA